MYIWVYGYIGRPSPQHLKPFSPASAYSAQNALQHDGISRGERVCRLTVASMGEGRVAFRGAVDGRLSLAGSGWLWLALAFWGMLLGDGADAGCVDGTMLVDGPGGDAVLADDMSNA